MAMTVAISAPGNMGAAIGGVLVDHDIEVRVPLAGRSAASIARAARFHLKAASDQDVAEADMILSIMPPGDALAYARKMAPLLSKATRKPIFVDCNAVSPETVKEIAAVIEATGSPFADAGIIGGPPKPGKRGPATYAAGPAASGFAELAKHGLDIRVLDGPVGAASALKMCYAGVNKGVIALCSAMMLAASRVGAADALHDQMVDSQSLLLQSLGPRIPDMYSKSQRWVAEMLEIADFLGDGPERKFFEGAAGLYERLAADYAGEKREIGQLDAFMGKPGK